MALRIVLIVNALATLAAGLALFISPGFLGAAVDIVIGRDAYFVYYLLGASELAIATLCVLALRLADPVALRMVCWTMIVFHTASGLAGVLAYAEGLSAAVWANVALRALMVGLFAWFGLRQRR